MIIGFWWSSGKEGDSIRWMRWKKMCQTKQYGGMGFGTWKALVVKQVWRLITRPNSILSRVVKAHYFPRSQVLQASYSWKSMWETIPVIKKGIKWRVGNGSAIDIWTDDWLSGAGQNKIETTRPVNSTITKVSDLILVNEDDVRVWNIDIIHTVFNVVDAGKIKSIPLSMYENDDIIVWKHTPSGTNENQDSLLAIFS